MATLVSKWEYPALNYAWIPEYVDKGTPVRVRPGQKLSVLARRARRRNSAYLNKGITHIYTNNGNSTDPDLPRSKRAAILNLEGVYGAMGGGVPIPYVGANGVTYPGWNVDQLETVIEQLVSVDVVGFLCEELGEKLSHQTPDAAVWGLYTRSDGTQVPKGMGLDLWNGSPQAKRVAEVISRRVSGFYGSYAGSVNLGLKWHDGFGAIKTALQSGQAAYDLLKVNLLFLDGAFAPGRNEYQIRNVMVKAYDSGDDNKERALSMTLCHIELTTMAMKHLNPTKRVGVVFFPGYSEPETSGKPHHIRYRRRVPATGGYVSRSTFPLWSMGYQTFTAMFGLARDCDEFNWESANNYGDDPNVVVSANELGTTYDGPPVVRADSKQEYTDESVPVGFPANPQSFYDIPFIGANLYTFMHEWGGYDIVPIPHKSVNNPEYTVIRPEYLGNRWEDKRGYCFMAAWITQEGVTQAAVVFLSNLPCGETELVTFDMGNGHTYTALMPGGIPRAFKFTL